MTLSLLKLVKKAQKLTVTLSLISISIYFPWGINSINLINFVIAETRLFPPKKIGPVMEDFGQSQLF